ncbi:MAG: transglycosylase domain-containing protein [Saprospiraceae bacterium]|nr:transglycosylase domain-containing protein [Saprospiraceae bacterium]
MSLKRLSGKELDERMPTYRKIIAGMWALLVAGILGVILTFVLLSFSDLPTIEELENPKSELASEIFGSNGEVLGRYYVENRVPVNYTELNDTLVNALISTEDERYFSHCGIDFRALGRIVFKTVLLGQKSSGGGSTITQQLAKLLFTEKPGSGVERVVQKLKEWIIALRLERRYTKEEIIAMYLNKFDFLYDSDGIKAAAETYFGKSQKDLKVEEAAVLIGMLKNPSLYNPKSRPESAKTRRNVVFQQMIRNDHLNKASYAFLSEKPIDMTNFKRSNHATGLAPYFRMVLAEYLKNDILQREECRKKDGSMYNIYRDGLKIYTTIDPKMQAIAEKVMVGHMKEVQKAFWQTWKWDDPWKYKTDSDTEVPLELREAGLKRLIRSTDRYNQKRDEIMSEILQKVEDQIDGLKVTDWEMELMLEEEKRRGAFSRELARDYISPENAAKLRDCMKSPLWEKLKKDWETFQKEADAVMNKKVPMTVFAYNEKMEKDTTMSPLDSIKYHRMFLQTGIMAVDPVGGFVKVWIGGVNHKYFQYDHVKSKRQVGSTFKPFVYATAINLQGISPCFTVYDQPQTIAPGDGNFGLLEPWTPSNSDGEYSGTLMTLYQGLKKSVNTVSVYLMKQLGDAHHVIQTCRQMGIDADIPAQPSICLGACDLPVIEMTGAYTTFANNGIANQPIFLTRIEDKNGKTIFTQLPEEHQALSPNANYVMVDMLKYATQGAYGFGNLKSECGGKTGTTNDYVDGWFMGITPDLVVGTWVGGEDRWIRFRSIQMGQGARMARPFFSSFIKALEESEDVDYDPEAKFYVPPGDIGIEMDCNVYKNPEDETDEPANNQLDFSEDQFGTTTSPLKEDPEDF